MRKFGSVLVLLAGIMSGCTASAPIAFACDNQVRIGPAKPCPPAWLYSFGRCAR